MKKAIVNLSTHQYRRGQQRLVNSLQGKTDADIITFSSEVEVGALPHKENPYSYKVYCFDRLFDMGYTQILWLDASAYAIGDVQPIFDIIENYGFFGEEAGHWASTWTNDFTLNYFGITRDEAEKIPLFSAGFTGINFEKPRGGEFFDRWKRSMEAGCFKGQWNNQGKTESQDPRCEGHRHDLAAASIIAYQMGLKFTSGGTYFQYAAPEDPINKETVIFKAQGI